MQLSINDLELVYTVSYSSLCWVLQLSETNASAQQRSDDWLSL